MHILDVEEKCQANDWLCIAMTDIIDNHNSIVRKYVDDPHEVLPTEMTVSNAIFAE